MKKLISIFITSLFISLMLFQQKVQAATPHNITFSNSYISLEDAKLLAQYTASLRIAKDNQCPWKNGFSYSDIMTFYDLNDNPNAYAFNLISNNRPAGYIFVNANKNSPNVEQFSYDGRFYIEKMLNKNFNLSNTFTNTNKIYYLSAYNFLIKTKESNNDVFYDVENKTKISSDINLIKSKYIQNLNSEVDKNSQLLLNNLKLNSLSSKNVSTNSQVIYYKYDVPNLSSTHFYTTDETYNYYPGDNNCSPTAGLTLIEYWHLQRGISSLGHGWTPSHFYNNLYYDMHTNKGHVGTTSNDLFNGLLNTSTNAGCSAREYDIEDNPSFSRVQGTIKMGIPVEIDLRNVAPYGKGHSVDVFGTELDNDGNWCRIADGWSDSYQTWYHFETLHPIDLIYIAWI